MMNKSVMTRQAGRACSNSNTPGIESHINEEKQSLLTKVVLFPLFNPAKRVRSPASLQGFQVQC